MFIKSVSALGNEATVSVVLAISAPAKRNRDSLMKAAFSKILRFFVSSGPGSKVNGGNRSYCICGALKPEAETKEPEAQLKTERRNFSSY